MFWVFKSICYNRILMYHLSSRRSVSNHGSEQQYEEQQKNYESSGGDPGLRNTEWGLAVNKPRTQDSSTLWK